MNKRAFSLAEMMVVLLVMSIMLAAMMPIISKRVKQRPTISGAGTSLWEVTSGNPNNIHNTNSGNVGVGTDSPTYMLDVIKSGGTGIDNFAYGDSKSRTETRNNAGLQGNAGAQSGFFQTSSPTNFPTGASSWWHLLDIRGSDPASNNALQIAGSFFDQHLWFRKTNGSATTAWREIEPTGSVIAFAGSAAPNGWLLCNGQAVSRATYAELYSVISTTYGSGDGSTTFNIPDLRGTFVRGAGTSGKLSNANGTAFSGTLGTYQNDKFQGHAITSSGGYYINTRSATLSVSGTKDYFYPDYSASSLILGNDGTNGTPRTGTETNPANLSLNYIIKF